MRSNNNNNKKPHSNHSNGQVRRNNHGGHNGGGHNRGKFNRGGGDANARKNASASRDKYLAMARDALSSGDRVLAEYYYQHAEHYVRIISALPPEEPQRRLPQNDAAEMTDAGEAPTSEQETPAAGSPPMDTLPVEEEQKEYREAV